MSANTHVATAESLQHAVQVLRAGGLVAFPTETVYGLGADALNAEAVLKIFAAKGRPADHPLIVHLPDADHLPHWASRIPREAIALANAFWPGPLTLILPREASVPNAVTGGQNTIGVRVPNHPVALQLLRAFGSGVAAPSANKFGRISPTLAQHVAEELGNNEPALQPYILDGGDCQIGIESTILDLSGSTPRILRPGAISAEQIAAVIGRAVEATSAPTLAKHAEEKSQEHVQEVVQNKAQNNAQAVDEMPRVSGSLAAHYAPRTPMQMLPTQQLQQYIAQQTGHTIAVLAYSTHIATACAAQQNIQCFSMPLQAVQYAHDLYASLRRADHAGAREIVLEAPPTTTDWQAVHDRLGRAVTGSGSGSDQDDVSSL